MAVAAEKWSFAAAARLGKIRLPLEEDDMDVDAVLDPKGKGKQKEKKRKRVDEEEEKDDRLPRPKKRRDEVIEIVEDSVPRTKKRKDRTNDQVIEDSMPRTTMSKPREENLVVAAKINNRMELERETVKEIVESLLRRKERLVAKPISTSGSEFKGSSSEEEVDSRPRPPIQSNVIHSRPRPPVSHLRPNSKSNRSLPIPTGKFYVPPCSTCRTAKVKCEKQATAEACVRCRKFKHKCEFAKFRKSKKITPVMESKDESSTVPLESHVRVLRQPKRLSSAPAVSQLTLFYISFIFTIIL